MHGATAANNEFLGLCRAAQFQTKFSGAPSVAPGRLALCVEGSGHLSVLHCNLGMASRQSHPVVIAHTLSGTVQMPFQGRSLGTPSVHAPIILSLMHVCPQAMTLTIGCFCASALGAYSPSPCAISTCAHPSPPAHAHMMSGQAHQPPSRKCKHREIQAQKGSTRS